MRNAHAITGLIRHVASAVLALMLASPLGAAIITDADLEKVTRLIQEGKTARAKAEVTILLDDNPNDPKAGKLRTLLKSLEASPGGTPTATTKPNASGAGPSAQETLEWIQSHISQLSYTSIPSMHEYTFTSRSVERVSVEKDSRLTLLLFGKTVIQGNHTYTCANTAIPIGSIIGTVEIVHNQGLAPDTKTGLRFTAQPDAVTHLESRYENYKGEGATLDGAKVSLQVNEALDEVRRRVGTGKGKQSTSSQFTIPVAPDQAERFKKAFDHLIKLHGGGKAEAF